jgi:ParB family transcriptional regulator, chromosome partitioning protein
VSKDRRLGRGLAALLGTVDEDERVVSATAPALSVVPAPHFHTSAIRETASERPRGEEVLRLNVYEIDDNPYQPRRDFSEPEIASLAESLKEHDMLQPILVRLVGQRYQLISGERRLRAAIQAGWKTVPVRVREADDRLVAELAIVENLQRKDLNPIEKALSFKRYLDEHHCTQDELAKRLKMDRSTIANLVRLLELPQTILDGIRTGSISAGHARALLPLGDERAQSVLATRIVDEGMSVREIERLVQEQIATEDGEELPEAAKASKARRAKRSEQVVALEQEFRKALGMKVEILARGKEKGKIVIHFTSQEDFQRLREQLGSV